MRFRSKTYRGSLELYDRNTCIQINNENYMTKKHKYRCHKTHFTCMWENKSDFFRLLLA